MQSGAAVVGYKLEMTSLIPGPQREVDEPSAWCPKESVADVNCECNLSGGESG